MTTHYTISDHGEVATYIIDNTQTSNGTASGSVKWYLPYTSVSGWISSGSVYSTLGNATRTGAMVTAPGDGYAWAMSATGQFIHPNDFTHTNDHITAELRYKAFEE